jgi:hypothetical protein
MDASILERIPLVTGLLGVSTPAEVMLLYNNVAQLRQFLGAAFCFR